MQPDMNPIAPPRSAADSDGPRENRPTLELAFRSGYVSVGTFDRFLKFDRGGMMQNLESLLTICV